MKVTLNLATRPFADLGPAIKRLRIGMGALALVSLLLFLGLRAIHHTAEAARARAHSLDGQLARIAQEKKSYQDLMAKPDNARLLNQAAVLNQLIDDKSFSWTLAMEDLETVLPGGVQVTSLEPARKDGRTTLHLRVLGPRDRAVEMVSNLEHSRRFTLPRIVGENAAEESNDRQGQRLQPVSAADRVDFDVQADYSPASAEERKANRKAAVKEASSEAAASASRPVHALPAPVQGRQPYSGTATPLNRPVPLPVRPNPVPNNPILGRPGPGAFPGATGQNPAIRPVPDPKDPNYINRRQPLRPVQPQVQPQDQTGVPQ